MKNDTNFRNCIKVQQMIQLTQQLYNQLILIYFNNFIDFHGIYLDFRIYFLNFKHGSIDFHICLLIVQGIS